MIGLAFFELGKVYLGIRYRASLLAYAFWVHKNAMPKNWLMRVKGLNQLNM